MGIEMYTYLLLEKKWGGEEIEERERYDDVRFFKI